MFGAKGIAALVLIGAMSALLTAPAVSQAAPDCPGAQPLRTILSGQGVLESVIADRDGHLYYTDTSVDSLMRLDTPTSQPVAVATGIDQPGGLVILPGGDILVGQGDGFVLGALGNIIGLANIIRVDPGTGTKTTYASGLSMANGLALGPAGEIYASDDAGTGIDKVVGPAVQRSWSTVISSNGLAVDRAGQNLYANQTFQPAAIQRIPLDSPGSSSTFATAAPEDVTAGLDGLTIDGQDRLFAAANGAGQIWRIDTGGSICVLARGLTFPSAVAFGSPDRDARAGRITGGFDPTSLYAVTFSGFIYEIPNARELPAGRVRIRLRVRPRQVRVDQRVTLRFRAQVVGPRRVRPLPRVRIRIAGRVARADAHGRARLPITFRRSGRFRARFLSPRLAGARSRVVRTF